MAARAIATSALLAGCWLALSPLAVAAWQTAFAPGPRSVAEVLAALIAACCVMLLAGQTVAVALGMASRIPGALGRAAARCDAALTPAVMRRFTALTLGGVITMGATPSTVLADADHRPVAAAERHAGAAPDVSFGAQPSAPDVGFSPESAPSAPDVGFVPLRPTVRPTPAPDVLGGFGLARPDGVVVHRGDNLWSIAAAALGPGATDAEIASEWPRWYAANREQIGPDPDLILPGTILRAPSAAPATSF